MNKPAPNISRLEKQIPGNGDVINHSSINIKVTSWHNCLIKS
jgi:hypothetical protein